MAQMILSKEEYELLMQYNKKPSKHPKIFGQIVRCPCGFRAMYKFLKCPACERVKE